MNAQANVETTAAILESGPRPSALRRCVGVPVVVASWAAALSVLLSSLLAAG